MSFSLKRKEPVAKAISRIGCERIENALASLNKSRQSKAIHCVRKEIKKTRALLRLVRPAIRKKAYRKPARLLWEVAAYLAAPRDAHVMTTALKHLKCHFASRLPARAFRDIRSTLENDLHRETARFNKHKYPRKIDRLLRKIASQFKKLVICREGWKALRNGINNTYANGRKAYHDARANPSDKNFHEWRKRTKDIWYQLRLLRPASPKRIGHLSRQLKDLTELLGNDHDIVMLRQTVESKCPLDRELTALEALIADRQHDLRASALIAGAQLFSEMPSTFCRRLEQSWHSWRNSKVSPGE